MFLHDGELIPSTFLCLNYVRWRIIVVYYKSSKIWLHFLWQGIEHQRCCCSLLHIPLQLVYHMSICFSLSKYFVLFFRYLWNSELHTSVFKEWFNCLWYLRGIKDKPVIACKLQQEMDEELSSAFCSTYCYVVVIFKYSLLL